jgi:hypothetical protein
MGADVEAGGGLGVEDAEGEALIGSEVTELEPGAEVEGAWGDGNGLGDAVVGDVLTLTPWAALCEMRV